MDLYLLTAKSFNLRCSPTSWTPELIYEAPLYSAVVKTVLGYRLRIQGLRFYFRFKILVYKTCQINSIYGSHFGTNLQHFSQFQVFLNIAKA